MEYAQVLRVKKLKGHGIINVAARHNLRETQAEIGADSHIDACKSSTNIVLKGAGRAAGVAAEAVRLLEIAKVKPLRKDAVRALEIIFSLPPCSGITERDFFTDSVAWAERFFEVPVLSAVTHNDEAAPHCHIILLPLFGGRMIGSALVGSRARLQAMQADFHAKVGQTYGLKRGTPTTRYSRSARALAADGIVTALRRNKNSFDDPAIRDGLRDVLAESMPAHSMKLLKLDLPEIRTPKPKTFASIMTQNKPERKNKKPIGFAIATSAQKEQSLSCGGFQSKTHAQPDDEYTRELDIEPSECWDGETGAFIRPTSRTKATSAEVDRVRVAIQAMRR